MRRYYVKKYQLIFLAFISLYLSNINVDASVANDESHGVAHLQKGAINLSDPYFAKKFKCPLLYGTFPDVEDCSRFYVCMAGFPRRMRCPPFFNFDKYARRCLAKWFATCDEGEEEKYTTLPDEKTTTVKEKIFFCMGMFGTYPHPTDCSKYYTCYFFIPSLQTCSNKKLYHVWKKECRPNSEVDCESRNRQTTKTRIATTPLYTDSTTREVATILEETTPETTTTEMPTGPPDTDCDENDLDCIITETGKIPLWFKCPAELDSYSHPSSKRIFIFCINWKPKVKKCGQDLIYSPKLKTCVSP